MTPSGDLTPADRWAIADVLARYCHASDARDFETVTSLLTVDAVGDFGPAGVHHGRDAMVAVSAAILTGLPATQHLVSTSAAEATATGAHVVTAFSARHLRDDRYFTVAGTYYDDFVRDGSQWLISARRIAVAWTEGDPTVLEIPGS